MADVQLNLVVIRAEDIDRAAEFYGLLGLEFQKHHHGSGPEHYASEQGGTVFEIYPRQKQAEGSAGTRIGFRVPSIDALIATLRGRGRGSSRRRRTRRGAAVRSLMTWTGTVWN